MTLSLHRRLLIAVLAGVIGAWFAGSIGRFVVVLALGLFGPGYLFTRILPLTMPRGAFVRLAIWLGLSISLIALLYEWCTAFGLSLTTPVLTGGAFVCGAGVFGSLWRRSAEAGHPQRGTLRIWLVLLVVFALTLWTRFYQIHDLALPAWVDSVHHALLIRVAAETGQAPLSLRPYMPIDDLPYHWGYHVFTAAVMQLSGLSLPQAMLWQGQVLNALHALTGAALASYLWRRPTAGIVAGIVVGLLSIMPAYYVSWGRYTQLTGLLLLPALAILWHAWLRAPTWAGLASVSIIIAGLSLVHIRVLIFSCTWLVVSAAVWAISQPWSAVRMRLVRASLLAALTLALIAPWLRLLLLRLLLPIVEQPQKLVGGGDYNALSVGLLWAGHNRWLVVLALVAAFWGLARRSRVTLELIGWTGMLVGLANPWLATYIAPAIGFPLAVWSLQQRRFAVLFLGLGLALLNPLLMTAPYFWLITNDAMVISLFLPISALIGGGSAFALDWLDRRLPPRVPPSAGEEARRRFDWRVPVRGVGFAALAGAALWGAWMMRDVINPMTVLATEGDVAAIEWAAANTPPDARFLVGAAPWLPTADRGADGGWWLLPLAGRWASVPPVLFTYGESEYVRDMRLLTSTLVNHTADLFQIEQIIERERITHVYLGSQSGSLSRDVVASREDFALVYQHDGVAILAVQQQP